MPDANERSCRELSTAQKRRNLAGKLKTVNIRSAEMLGTTPQRCLLQKKKLTDLKVGGQRTDMHRRQAAAYVTVG